MTRTKTENARPMVIAATVAMSVLLYMAGCSDAKREQFTLPKDKDLTELVPRLESVVTGKVSKVEELQPDDVIVAVNGYPLTRNMYDEQIAIIARYAMMRPGMNPYVLNERIEQMKRDFVKQFPKKRLLIDEAKRLKLTSTEIVNSNICNAINENCKKLGKSPEQVLKGFRGDPKIVLCEMAEQEWIDAIVKDRIPPKVNVDAAFVSNVQARVAAENAAALRTNEWFKAQMKVWKAQVEKGERTFEDVAEKESRFPSGKVKPGGLWGEFEREEMDSRVVARAAFKVEKGGITDPIEDDNGFYLVKVLDIKAPVCNDKGTVIEKERRRLARVYIEKEPEILRQTDDKMFADLKKQMQARAINEFVEVLATNGNHKVVFPHGTKFF